MHGTYVGNGRVLVQTTFGAKLLAASDDLSLMPDLVVHGGYDEPFTNYVRRTLSAGQIAVDAGANIGLFTMLMAWQVGQTGKVLSYECEPNNMALLRDNVGLNYASWVELHEVAVGSQAGQATMYRTTRFRGNGSLYEHNEDYNEHFRDLDQIQELTVEVKPLDEQLGRFEQIDLIKVDVEGAELAALQGMRNALASGTVDRISLEVTRNRMPAEVWPELVAELRGLHAAGWTYSTIDAEGTLHPLTLEELIDRGLFAQVLMQRPPR